MKLFLNTKHINFISLIFLTSFTATTVSAQNMIYGLRIEPENRCSSYDKKAQYPYPQSVEDKIISEMGGLIYGPYSGNYFESDTQTDIEHIVASSEGHDSGLCRASPQKRIQFANDLLNLTLAAPIVNRCSVNGKCGFDAGEWLPEKNKCWFSGRVVQVKQKYDLSVDLDEAKDLKSVLSSCENTDLIYFPREESVPLISNDISITEETNALALYDDNNNGRITCNEAKVHGISPVHHGHIAYVYMNDRDGDGVVCE